MVELARLRPKQLLDVYPALNIGEVHELIIPRLTLWLKRNESHDLLD